MSSHDTLIKRCKLLLYSISDKEAVIPIKDHDLYMGIERYKEECIVKLLELLDKETPMKPLEVEDSHFICKNCNETIVPIGQRKVWHNIFTKYHNCCGQKLDWSDEE